jgi:hypothetical protein
MRPANGTHVLRRVSYREFAHDLYSSHLMLRIYCLYKQSPDPVCLRHVTTRQRPNGPTCRAAARSVAQSVIWLFVCPFMVNTSVQNKTQVLDGNFSSIAIFEIVLQGRYLATCTAPLSAGI